LGGLDALNSLFGWLEGEFEFSEEQVTTEKAIKKSRMEIILDGLRMLDDGQIEKVGPVSVQKAVAETTGREEELPQIKGPLIDYTYIVDEEEFPSGHKITEEGKFGSWIWVILDGVVDIVKETPRGPIKMVRLGDGAIIGSIAAFLMQGSVRSATALAVGDVQAGVLDSQRLASEFACLSPQFRELLLSLDRRLRYVTEAALKFQLGQNPLKAVLKGKDAIIKQGEEERRLINVLDGQASIVRNTDHGLVPLVTLEKGDFIGPLPFLDIGHEPDSALVLASHDFEAVTVDTEELQDEYSHYTTAWKNIIEYLGICISVTTNQACSHQKDMVKRKKARAAEAS
jgi:CRP-like cAMP-binding protein